MPEETLLLVEDYLDGKLHVFDKDWPELPFAHREHIGCTVDYVAGRNRYMGYLISLGIYSFKGVKVGLDCANGASWNIAKSVFDALGADTYVINNKPNGTNINNNAGSTHIEGLQKFVVEKGLDVGFAYDGDADRCLCVDEKGNVITGDHILYEVVNVIDSKGYLYTWNYIVGASPRLYETLFPAWFGFYYLGIQVRCGWKLKGNGFVVAATLLLSCVEAIGLRATGLDIGFYTSQITAGSFLYSFAMIGWLLKKNESNCSICRLLSKIGDCSYGIFYIHMAVLMIVGRIIQSENWYIYWILRFMLTTSISYIIVHIGQMVLKSHKKLLRYIGFI